MRFIQHPITHKLIPAEEYERPNQAQHYIHDDIRSFVSPVDGSVISDRNQLREHNKRNRVVSADEFPQSHYDKKAKERHDVLNGNHSRGEKLKRKQEIYETIIRAERQNER